MAKKTTAAAQPAPKPPVPAAPAGYHVQPVDAARLRNVAELANTPDQRAAAERAIDSYAGRLRVLPAADGSPLARQLTFAMRDAALAAAEQAAADLRAAMEPAS